MGRCSAITHGQRTRKSLNLGRSCVEQIDRRVCLHCELNTVICQLVRVVARSEINVLTAPPISTLHQYTFLRCIEQRGVRDDLLGLLVGTQNGSDSELLVQLSRTCQHDLIKGDLSCLVLLIRCRHLVVHRLAIESILTLSKLALQLVVSVIA